MPDLYSSISFASVYVHRARGTERNNSYSFLKPLHKQNTNDVRYSDHLNTSGIYSFDFFHIWCIFIYTYIQSSDDHVQDQIMYGTSLPTPDDNSAHVR